MLWYRINAGGCDALDVAAIWPWGQVSGFPVPEIDLNTDDSGSRLSESKDDRS